MSKTNSGSNGRKKLFVVGGKTEEQLEREAEKIRMNAQYLKWIRSSANDQQILELRDELRERRVNMTHNVAQHETLQREYLTIQRMLCHVLVKLFDAWDMEEVNLEITNEGLNETIGGKHLVVEINEDKTGWYVRVQDPPAEGDSE